MDHDDDGETSYNTFVDDVAFEPTYLQALLTAAGRNVATQIQTYNQGVALNFLKHKRLADSIGLGSIWSNIGPTLVAWWRNG